MIPKYASRFVVLLLSMSPALCAWGVDLAPVNVDSLIKEARTRQFDSSYGYVYVLDKQDTDLRPDYTYEETYHGISLVLSSEGVRRRGTLVLSYRLGYDSITTDIARVHAPDGTIQTLADEDILKDVMPSDLMANNLYTDRRQIRFLFKNLQVGSIVELKHTTRRVKVDWPAYSDWFLHQATKPILLSQNAIRYPSNLPVEATERRMTTGPQQQTVDSHTVMVWRSEEVPAFQDEPGSPPQDDLIPGVYFSTLGDWARCSALMYDTFWRADLETPLGDCETALLERLNLEGATPMERLKAIYFALQKDVRYLGLEFGSNNLQPHASAVICANAYGDCKDKSNLLIKLLAHEGIRAVPAAVATTDVTLDLDTATPVYAMLNHVVVYVPDIDGQSYWLDPTTNYASAGWLPPSVHNAQALLLVAGGNGTLFRIPMTASAVDREETSARVILGSRGEAQVAGRRVMTGLKSNVLKSRFANLTKDQLDKMMQSAVLSSPGARLAGYESSGLEHYDSAFTLNLDYYDPQFAQRAGDMLIVGGQADRVYSSEFDNSGNLEQRTLDLYLAWQPSFRRVSTTILPDSFVVRDAPGDTVRACDFVSFIRVVRVYDDSVTVTTQFAVLDPFIPVGRYPEYRDFLNEIDALGKEPLILERAD